MPSWPLILRRCPRQPLLCNKEEFEQPAAVKLSAVELNHAASYHVLLTTHLIPVRVLNPRRNTPSVLYSNTVLTEYPVLLALASYYGTYPASPEEKERERERESRRRNQIAIPTPRNH